MPIEKTKVLDLSFEEYTRRQEAEVSAERIMERAAIAKPAGNFHYRGNKWIPQSYRGFAILSMMDANPGNEPLLFQLSALQDELRHFLTPPAYYMLPPASFHQTIANTVSAERYRSLIVDKGLEAEYPDIVGAAISQILPAVKKTPIPMRLIGLSIFGTSLGLLGCFEKEEDYDRIIRFRSLFYGNERLSTLEINRTRPFIGHITLTYIEQELDIAGREHLAKVILRVNETIRAKHYSFTLSTTGLYRYDHLAGFHRENSWRQYQL